MSVYIIAEFIIHTRASYDKYDALFMDVFEQFDGEVLSVDEEPTVLEGEWASTRSVLITFPSEKSAMAWMVSEAYQDIAKHRLAGSTGRVRMVKAFDAEAFTARQGAIG